jgi:glycerate dehydrogenase
VHPRTAPEELAARAGDAEVVLTNKTRLGADELSLLPALRYVGVLATGHDVVDVRAAHGRGIVVSNVPAYSTDSVAQLTFALLLELCNHVGLHAQAAREGRWTASGDFSHREQPLLELAGKTLGIVGLGRIGSAVGAIGAAFGMRVIAASGTAPALCGGASLSSRPAPSGIERVSRDELFARADVVSLHCPLTAQTARVIAAPQLARMKPEALLINTARGGLIDEPALLDALRAGRIGGAALDVLTVEPPASDHPLLHAPRCIVTPHIAWATREARARLLAVAVENVRAFLAGSPRNVVAVPA